MSGIRNGHLGKRVRTGLEPCRREGDRGIPYFAILVFLILAFVAYHFWPVTEESGSPHPAQLSPTEVLASQACAIFVRQEIGDPEADFMEGAYVRASDGMWQVRRRTRAKSPYFPGREATYECILKRVAGGRWVLLSLKKVG